MNWTVCILPVIFYALFSALYADSLKTNAEPPKKGGAETKGAVVRDDTAILAELEAARGETEMLRKELAGVLLKSEEMFGSYRRLQLSVASTVANSEKGNATDDELKALESFAYVRQEMKSLLGKTVELSQFIGLAFEKKELTDADKVRVKIKLEDLKATAEKLNVLISPPEPKDKADKCRILAVDSKLQIALLDAGTVNGVNTGLVWRVASGGAKSVRLKIIAVRPFISAAAVLEGDFATLAPGMQVHLGER